MKGIEDLNKILKSLEPLLNEDSDFIFHTIEKTDISKLGYPVHGTIVEDEGLTLIVTKEVADEMGFQYDSTFSKITLQVHSSLDAVGLTAVFSTALAEAGLSCNVVAGYFHDHLFVPQKDADRAMLVLKQLQVDAVKRDSRRKFNSYYMVTLSAGICLAAFLRNTYKKGEIEVPVSPEEIYYSLAYRSH